MALCGVYRRGNLVIAFLTTAGLIAMTLVAVWLWVAYRRSEQARQTPQLVHHETDAASLRDLARQQALGRMVGGVAHDLNNALTVLIMNLDILSQDNALAEKHGRRFKNMMNAASRGSSLVRHLLSFSDKRRPDPEVFCLSEMVPPVVELMQAALGKDPTVRALAADDEHWPVYLDAPSLEIAVMHLALVLGDMLPHGGEIVVEVANLAKGPPETAGEQVALILRTMPSADGAAATPVSWDPGRVHGFVGHFIRTAKAHLAVTPESGNSTRVTVYFPRCLDDDA